jgi:hypothetical protein
MAPAVVCLEDSNMQAAPGKKKCTGAAVNAAANDHNIESFLVHFAQSVRL